VLGAYPFQDQLGRALEYTATHNPLSQDTCDRLYECLRVDGPIPGGVAVCVALFRGDGHAAVLPRQSSEEEGADTVPQDEEDDVKRPQTHTHTHTRAQKPSASAFAMNMPRQLSTSKGGRDFSSSAEEASTPSGVHTASFSLPDNNGYIYIHIYVCVCAYVRACVYVCVHVCVCVCTCVDFSIIIVLDECYYPTYISVV
jgi:hypothetical protein